MSNNDAVKRCKQCGKILVSESSWVYVRNALIRINVVLQRP